MERKLWSSFSQSKRIQKFENFQQKISLQAADAEREKYQADLEQQRVEENYSTVEKLVEKLQKDYRRAINKSQ